MGIGAEVGAGERRELQVFRGEKKRVPHRAWRPVRSDKELSGDLPALSDPASEDLQGGGVFSVVVGLYDDVHVLIEGD